MTALYDSTVTHVRRERMDRTFHHRVHYWLVDLDALPRYGPLASFRAADHLGVPARSIKANLAAWLAGQGISVCGRVLMLANARVFGYVFNPLTLYWVHDERGEVDCVVAEVHNTYGERHCYLLRPDEDGRARVAKDFYVSPFLAGGGEYLMRVPLPGERLSVAVALRQDGNVPFTATLVGTRKAPTLGEVVRMVLRGRLLPHRVSALIRKHGITLWLRRVPVVPRPKHAPQEGVQ
ncbi:DUF1365 domain-containing protein [Actinokineospora fastidiosa]|uniref:DUF1365 domain-containing protein n=1 Tax=Actinokineospora fastidiosa TaxID=1816 RepID=A0A918GNY9_9PSEU|nr:DUF1365 domain-containing protein [Actinokineospora fastidiosa]GGS50000.1 DUF1365 domain-containing protein [Actinokineospora fastidiosa]